MDGFKNLPQIFLVLVSDMSVAPKHTFPSLLTFGLIIISFSQCQVIMAVLVISLQTLSASLAGDFIKPVHKNAASDKFTQAERC